MIRVFFYILFSFTLSAAAQKTPVTDGPYVFYKNDRVFIETIVDGKVKIDSLAINAQPVTLSVPIPGNSDKHFTFSLKSSLEIPPSDYKKPEKIFVLSDVEGNFTGLVKLLQAGSVVNEKLEWTFGKGHLVICGDLFDRGSDVTQSLWLLYKLEDEAKAKGGNVHVVLGNHEIMNLSEDIRYVHSKYLEAATLLERTYMDFYAPDTELGRWLRTKNIMEKIGNSLFLHAGISEPVLATGYSLKKINNVVRPYYDQDGYDSVLIKGKVTPFFNFNSPFWYRGYFTTPLASMAHIDNTLSYFNVKRIVVGHTIVDNIKTLYDGKVVAIDVNHHQGNHQALLIERDELFRITAKGEKYKL